MIWIKFIQSLLETLNADVSPEDIAFGIVLGTAVGLIPKANLIALALALVIWSFRVNLGMAGAAIFIISILSKLTDPLAEKLGYWLLSDVRPLQGLWTFLYNVPIVPYTAFNHTLVMGNLALALLLALPIYFGAKRGVIAYRARYRERIVNSRVMQLFKATKVYDTYQKWKQFRHR